MKKLYVVLMVLALISAGILIGSTLSSRQASSDTKNHTPATPAAAATSGAIIDLSGKGITEVSSSIYSKIDTTTLLLSNNAIQTLPSQMGKMTNLTVFKIDHNHLNGSLIGEVRLMSKLKTLDVSYNNMTGMPAEIGQLHSLETLNYTYNKVTGLPNELANLKDNLKEFDLTGNPLNAEQIRKLQAALPNTKIVF